MRLFYNKTDLYGFIAFVAALIVCSALFVHARLTEPHNTWGESAEFSQLATGQERFSEHETNVPRWVVVVDHQTGVQYLADASGRSACPLLDADGTPLLVAEAGE